MSNRVQSLPEGLKILLGKVARRPVTRKDVVWAYRLFFGRDPENDAVITEKVARTNDIRVLIDEFVKSDEYNGRQRRFYEAGGVSENDVTWAYRLLLGRDPEDRSVLEAKLKKAGNLKALVEELAGASEYKHRPREEANPTMSGGEPPMSIQIDCTDEELASLFEHIRNAWESLGRSQPHWSVMAQKEYLPANLAENTHAFYESGRAHVERLFGTLTRNGVDVARLKTCLEYGCGVGRTTQWLAEKLERIEACDISGEHLELARKHMESVGIRNVTFRLINRPEEARHLPHADLVWCVIVLQHNPPPVIAFLLRGLLDSVKAGGIAVFQVPTYRLGYTFSARDYLANDGTRHDMEMHVLPQAKIFDIARSTGMHVLEVFEDNWTGYRRNEVSSTFVMQRPPS